MVAVRFNFDFRSQKVFYNWRKIIHTGEGGDKFIDVLWLEGEMLIVGADWNMSGVKHIVFFRSLFEWMDSIDIFFVPMEGMLLTDRVLLAGTLVPGSLK